jgi:hypothetical protein
LDIPCLWLAASVSSCHLKVAKALGIEVPTATVLRADEVIE